MLPEGVYFVPYVSFKSSDNMLIGGYLLPTLGFVVFNILVSSLSVSLRLIYSSPAKSLASSPKEPKTLDMSSLWVPTNWLSAVMEKDGLSIKMKKQGKTR